MYFPGGAWESVGAPVMGMENGLGSAGVPQAVRSPTLE
jgi:hypothetical protein